MAEISGSRSGERPGEPGDRPLRTARTVLFLLVPAALALVTLPRLLKIGQFFDGVTAAAIARNMAQGWGTLWVPYYTDTVHPTFHQYFPLGLWLQSWVYRLLGDDPRLDTLWGLAMGIVLVALTVPAWRLGWRAAGAPCGAWWPAVLLVAFPLTAQVLGHNLLESTLAVFVLAASLATLYALERPGPAALLLGGAAAGLLLVGGVLSKGPQAVFPVVLPLAAAACFPDTVRWPRASVLTLLVAGVIALGLGALYGLHPGARVAIDGVVAERIGPGLRGERELASTRLEIVGTFLYQLTVAMGVVLLAALVTRTWPRVSASRPFAFFLLVGAAGSVPFLLTRHQFGRYLYPSLPFLAMALASLFAPVAAGAEARVARSAAARRLVQGAAGLGLLLAVVLMTLNAGTVRRASEIHADLTRERLPLPPRTQVTVCPPRLATHWELVAIMQRVYRVSLVPGERGEVVLVERDQGCAVPPTCTRLQRDAPARYLVHACPAGAG